MTEHEHQPDPQWLWIARRELGVHETPGAANTERIQQYLASTHLPPARHEDETPWCAAFVGWCLARAGIEPTRSAAARSYLAWGRELEMPQLGCVAVFSRPGADHPGSGHVAFFTGMDKLGIRVLGGNQANSVCERVYPASRLLSYRWPA